MRVIVTRPEREAQRWVRDFSAHGLDAVALPLIQIGPVADTAALVQAWQHLSDYVGVMFVSANAVDHFFASKPPGVSSFMAQTTSKTKVWAPGPGTAHALLRAGVAVERLDTPAPEAGQFDSEALWQVMGVQVRHGGRVLVVRGQDAKGSAGQGTGRAWFANRVAQAGGQTDFVVAYQRGAPEWHAQELECARQATRDASIWLFSSSEAVTHLCALLPQQSWRQARALATHPRIVQAAQKAGFGVVRESRPTLPDVMASLTLWDKPPSPTL